MKGDHEGDQPSSGHLRQGSRQSSSLPGVTRSQRDLLYRLHDRRILRMRLWSLHPRHLDSRGLVALWREGLLAQAVLRGETKGYRHHPQLVRFRAQPSAVSSIGAYLTAVHVESISRGYRFDAGKIAQGGSVGRMDVPRGQVEFEWNHLMRKLEVRAPEWYERQLAASPVVHPLFRVVAGGVANWERVGQSTRGRITRPGPCAGATPVRRCVLPTPRM